MEVGACVCGVCSPFSAPFLKCSLVLSTQPCMKLVLFCSCLHFIKQAFPLVERSDWWASFYRRPWGSGCRTESLISVIGEAFARCYFISSPAASSESYLLLVPI